MEKLTLNNLLSWKDVFNLGDPCGYTSTYFSREILEICCKGNYDKEILNNNLNKYIFEPFKEAFPDLDVDIEEFDIRFNLVKDENGNWKPVFSKAYFFTSLIEDLQPIQKHYDFLDKLNTSFLVYPDTLKENTINTLKELKKSVSEIIYLSNTKPQTVIRYNKTTGEVAAHDNNYLLDLRKNINYCIRNYDEISSFLDRDFPIEILESVDKDKFILNLLASSIAQKEILDILKGKITLAEFREMLNQGKVKSILNYANNYKLMIDYLNKENDDNYNMTMMIDSKERRIPLPSSEVLEEFEKVNRIFREDKETKEHLEFFDSYEELLKTKAAETWNRIQNEKLVKNIKVNFEMIKSGPKVTLDRVGSINKHRMVNSNNEKRQAKLKHDYDVLDEKMDYFHSKNPVINLVGINTFTGYFAQFYENGSVVLDKLYRYGKDRRGNEVIQPAGDEAIYVMNYREFAELSKYTKSELIQEITDYDNKDVKRIYHSTNWKKKVDKVIDGEGYGGLDLDFLNQLTLSLTGEALEEEKVKRI